MTSDSVVFTLSVLTVIGQAIALILLVIWLTGIFSKKKSPGLQTLLSRYGLVFIWMVALIATLGSLYFSEIAFWTPCKYCWLQRIFMYPLAVMLPIAIWKKDRNVARYVLALAVIGAIFATIHYTEQVQTALQPLDPLAPCDESGISCGATEINFHFGYITIPMMALTAFVMNIFMALLLLQQRFSTPQVIAKTK